MSDAELYDLSISGLLRTQREYYEAKLAKAVGHLEKLDRLTARDAALVQSAIAELKGQDDE